MAVFVHSPLRRLGRLSYQAGQWENLQTVFAGVPALQAWVAKTSEKMYLAEWVVAVAVVTSWVVPLEASSPQKERMDRIEQSQTEPEEGGAPVPWSIGP